MSVIAAAGRALAPVERLVSALEDRTSRDRAALALILGYVLVWSLYGAIAKSSQDVHMDMAEMLAWSRHPALGYPKHPPLGAWEAALWFAVFPRADWAFYLLAMANVGVALWAAWRIFARTLDPRRCAVALALLSLIPLLNFQALKFTPNVVLVPTWALTTLFTLRSLETRRPADAALAGIAAAAAMLAKYWSIYLLLGLVVAVLCDPRRRAYFRSAAPWITVLAGFAALAPHLAWLVANGFAPIGYAVDTYGQTGLADAAHTAVAYLLGAAAYVAVPTLLGMSAMRAQGGAARDTIWPPSSERRTVALAFWFPLLLPFVVTLATGGRTTPLWTMCNWTLFPVVLLSSPLLEVKERAAARVIAGALVWPLVTLAASPLIAVAIHRAGVPHSGAHYRQLAGAIERAWHGATGAPLRIVGGQSDLAFGAAFYLPGPPLVMAEIRQWSPWVDEAMVARDGIALVCQLDEPPCVGAIEASAAQRGALHRTDVELARRYLGMTGPSERFVIVIVPPQR